MTGPFLRRLAEGAERCDLGVDLLLQGDDHRVGVVDPKVRRLLERVILERPVQRQEGVVALVDELPLVRVGHRDAPPVVQGIEALKRRAAGVVHHHEEGARRPVVADVVGTETLLDVGRPLGADHNDRNACTAPARSGAARRQKGAGL